MRVSIERRLAIKSAYKAGLSVDEIALLTGFETDTINKILFPIKKAKETSAKELAYISRQLINSKIII